jgi:hypothetical protein
MIDPQVFEQEIAILMDWFNRDFEPETLKRLHQRLSAQLTTGQFVQAAKIVFDTSRFFPTVEEFVSAVIGDAQTNALHEWDLCVKAAARNDREIVSRLSAQGQSALHLVGGLYKLGMATEEQLVWIKKEFVGVWKLALTDVKSLPASNNCEPTSLDAVRSLPNLQRQSILYK